MPSRTKLKAEQVRIELIESSPCDDLPSDDENSGSEIENDPNYLYNSESDSNSDDDESNDLRNLTENQENTSENISNLLVNIYFYQTYFLFHFV